MRSLSGGERNRLLLARLFARPANVLVLDEPTNDLDIDTLELLEELLQNYNGTVFIVSHDRTFLDNVATSTLVFEATDDNPNIKSYVGRGDVVATLHRGNGHTVSLLYRNSLSFGANRGFLQLDWLGNNITGGAVRPYFQYTSGYGETLIDYNFRQWTVGAGFAFDIGR